MDGILLMAYGTPNGMDDIERYYTMIMRGKRPSDIQLDRLRERYKMIGGVSPLLKITERQASGLESKIRSNGDDAKVYTGMKYSKPYIREAIATALDDGVDNLVCIPIAPFYSKIGTGSYYEHVSKALIESGSDIRVVRAESWNMKPGLIDAWSERISEVGIDRSYVLLFTAHSMPITNEDNLSRYRNELLQTSNAVQGGFGNKWSLSFQSRADMGGEWIGPDVKVQIRGLGLNGVSKIAIAPIGFVSDNLETMYDIGIECRELCAELGIEVTISGMPNDSDGVIRAIYNTYKRISPTR